MAKIQRTISKCRITHHRASADKQNALRWSLQILYTQWIDLNWQEYSPSSSRQGKCPELFVQVNTGEEKQKSGVIPAETEAFVTECLKMDLPLMG